MFKLPIAGLLGIVAAAALFYLLSSLVGGPLDVERQTTHVVRLPGVRADTPLRIHDRRRTVKPQPADRPSVPALPSLDVGGPREITGMTGIPSFTPGRIAIGGIGPRFGGGGTDGDATPLVRVLPTYPPHLQGREIEGWVRVRFNVAADGTVKDARVVASQPEREFDTAALAAVARWRYRPRVEGGTPVERVGLETILRFELE